MAASSAEIGAIIAAKYRVIGKLGQGGMGVVLLAVHEPLGVKVAVKVIGGDGRSSADKKRFLLEAQAAAQLRGANIARVTDFGSLDDGRQYMVMEHLEGEDLGTLLERRGRLGAEEAVDFVVQACAGLAEAHATGIVHRDVKPTNLFVTQASDGSALLKVLDFGVSKFDAGLSAPPAITSAGLAVGTPLYMSPEQIKARGVDARSDVWALGVVLFELISGVSPFYDDSLGVTLVNILERPHGALRDRAPAVDEGLARLIDACLAKEAADRPQTVVLLAEQLARFASPDGRRLADRVRAISERAGAREQLALTPSTLPAAMQGPTRKLSASEQSETGSALPTMRAFVRPPGVGESADDLRAGDTPAPGGGTSTTSTATEGSKAVAIGAIAVFVLSLGGVALWLASARLSASSRAEPDPNAVLTPERTSAAGASADSSAMRIEPQQPSSALASSTTSALATATATTAATVKAGPARPSARSASASPPPPPSASQRRTLY